MKGTAAVARAARSELSFQADAPGALVEPLVRNLPNGEHTVELVTAGDGEVVIEGLYVYQPPERESRAPERPRSALPGRPDAGAAGNL